MSVKKTMDANAKPMMMGASRPSSMSLLSGIMWISATNTVKRLMIQKTTNATPPFRPTTADPLSLPLP